MRGGNSVRTIRMRLVTSPRLKRLRPRSQLSPEMRQSARKSRSGWRLQSEVARGPNSINRGWSYQTSMCSAVSAFNVFSRARVGGINEEVLGLLMLDQFAEQ